MIEIDRDTVEAFASLFRGRTDSHGRVEVCIYEPVTLEHYKKHLQGKVNLGIYFLLDDSTCYFAAIDLDEKDFNKAKAIRDELVKSSIPAYIAASKSRGYHIYCFAFEGFKAVEIRQVLNHVLRKLNIRAEVFPKQDYHQPDDPDGKKHPGSYINLPSFGYTRPFLSGDMSEVKLEVAIEQIKFVPQISIDRVLQTMRKEKPLASKKVVGRRKKHPPCLEAISNGVEERQRDAAAFALARHYLIQAYEPGEVFWLLQEWDAKNKTPSYDETFLENTVRLAEKYRGLICPLIKDKSTVSTFCVGDEKCDWPKLKKLEEGPLTKKQKPEKAGKKKHCPCITKILWGVNKGQRDEAAFAIAKYYIDEIEYPPEEVLGLLKVWDKNNKPPFNDDSLLEIKVRSASEKGYPFGCGSIRDNPTLSEFCVGEENCEWWREITKKREKRDRYLIKNKKDEPIKVNIKALVNDLMDEFIFKTIFGFVRDDILIYEDGVYNDNGEKVIRENCETRVGAPMMTTHTVSEVKNHIARFTFTDREKFNTEKYIINFENGLFDVNTRELKPHTPDFLSTIRIPIIYDPQAKCPKVQNFLSSILREDGVEIILEFFGYSLIPDYSIPVVLILLGEGSNGKTQLLHLLDKFIGKKNYTSVSLQDIEDDSFAVSNLEGKLLNIQGDLSSKWLSGVGMLKKLSGQDPIYANRKHKDPIQFDNFARLVFASNKPPIIEEDTLAIWRRILPIDLPNVFEGKKDIKNYVDTILTTQELSGLLNLALEGLQRLLNNRDFSYHGSYSDRSRHYTIASDPARVFVEECCNIGSDFRILKNELYQAYVLFCKKNKIQLSGESQLGKELRRVPGLSISDKQYQEKGIRVRWWLNITLKSPGQEAEQIDMEV